MAERPRTRRAPKPLKKGVERIRRERKDFLRGLAKPARSRFSKRGSKK